MIKVVSLWKLPDTLSEAEFEAWYQDKHIGDAKRIPGLKRYTVNKVIDEEKSQSAYYRMAELSFETVEAARAAFASPEFQYASADTKGKLDSPIRLFFQTEDVIG